jgi:4-oxalocrotonate tautomerase
MPNITCEGPPIKELEAKRQLVKEITEAAHKAYKLPRDVIVVVIRENAPENVGVGGELIVDRRQRESGKPGD